MAYMNKDINLESLIESCKPIKKRGRPSHKRQLHEIRAEKKINLQTSDSVVTAINLKSILTLENLQSLPLHCQNQLIRLLPSFDQITDEKTGSLKASDTSLSNEYFARFCARYLEKLSDNKLSEKALEQARTDTTRELARLDPWKLKNFEPIWGQKLVSQCIDDEFQDELDTPLGPPKLDQNIEKKELIKKHGMSQRKRRRIASGFSHLARHD